ncbi:MAG: 3-hydroxyacyl-CoA dehydrogenase NAD-binding domain-containing protein [Pseudomonadota bacterium]
MAQLEGLAHWRCDVDAAGVAWLVIDRAGEDTNTLGRDVLDEFGRVLTALEADTPAGLVLMSGKASGFIAGADIREFDHLTSASEVTAGITEAHALFQRFEDLRCHKVAAIDGFCLGGGLELALCCDYLIATDDPKTRIGLPEVKLGIFPGFGGSVRLTHRIGAAKAMPLMLAGKLLKPSAARAQGVIDAVSKRHGSLRWDALNAVQRKRKSVHPTQLERLTNSRPAREALSRVMVKQTAAKAREAHYPAPFRLIESWRAHGGDKRAQFAAEADEVGKLMVGPSARGLRRVFNLMESLKRSGKTVDFPVRRVHVVGAGVMGGDIAAWCVQQGLEVTLQDREMRFIEPALKRAHKQFARRLRGGALVAAKARLIPDLEGNGVPRADVVIEAIIEDAEIKQTLFKALEPRMRADAVLATNTSSIPLESLTPALQDPTRLVGLHFFNPVAKMPLLEVVRGDQTDPVVVQRGLAFGQRIGKLPLAVKSSPGFLVNRVLSPYMLKAVDLHLEKGIKLENLDEAALRFGMPMGPVELADVVGLDVCQKVAETLSAPAALQARIGEFVSAGKLGKKSGEGNYRWEKGKAVKQPFDADAAALDEIEQALLEPFYDECQACLRDGVVESEDELDAGIVFGTGFAPFRGGPLFHLSSGDHA